MGNYHRLLTVGGFMCKHIPFCTGWLVQLKCIEGTINGDNGEWKVKLLPPGCSDSTLSDKLQIKTKTVWLCLSFFISSSTNENRNMAPQLQECVYFTSKKYSFWKINSVYKFLNIHSRNRKLNWWTMMNWWTWTMKVSLFDSNWILMFLDAPVFSAMTIFFCNFFLSAQTGFLFSFFLPW